MKLLRLRLALELDPKLRTQDGLSNLNSLILVLIFASLIITIIETEPLVLRGREDWFSIAELFFIVVFSIEYIARVWVCTENPENVSRLRYMLKPHSLLDLITLMVVILSAFGTGAFLLRIARVLRVLRIAKLARYSAAINLISDAINRRRFELGISIMAAIILLIVTSSLLYLAEGSAQEEAFGSIPRAMWWSIATLTTVGYGDVYPITSIGKLFAAFTALSGIGLIAMPTGILAAAVSEAIQGSKDNTKDS
jgi:voltage-gated potassium channel